MAKKKTDPKSITLKTVVITAKKKTTPKMDSTMVGGTKRSLKDISDATATLRKSPTAANYVNGVDSANPAKSSSILRSRNSTTDLINSAIDFSKKKKPLVAKKK